LHPEALAQQQQQQQQQCNAKRACSSWTMCGRSCAWRMKHRQQQLTKKKKTLLLLGWDAMLLRSSITTAAGCTWPGAHVSMLVLRRHHPRL
jgi:hypothetical protein